MAGANRCEKAIVATVAFIRAVGDVSAAGPLAPQWVEGEAVRELAAALGAIVRVVAVAVTVTAITTGWIVANVASTAFRNVIETTSIAICHELWIHCIQKLCLASESSPLFLILQNRSIRSKELLEIWKIDKTFETFLNHLKGELLVALALVTCTNLAGVTSVAVHSHSRWIWADLEN